MADLNVKNALPLLGVAIAAILAFAGAGTLGGYGPALLVVIGLIAGFMNISKDERMKLLLSGIAISVISGALAFSVFGDIGGVIGTFFTNLFALVAPYTLVVALLEWMEAAKK